MQLIIFLIVVTMFPIFNFLIFTFKFKVKIYSTSKLYQNSA